MSQFKIIEEFIKKGIKDTNKPSFNLITGSAGSGKTTLLKEFNQAFKKSSIVAPTGVAALNCGGITIHSFLKIGTKGNLKKLAKGKNVTGEYKKVFENLDLLIIDEISFVSAPLLDGLSSSLKKIRENEDAFGGVSILCSGDLFQLPPVIPQEEKKELEDLGYKSKYFFHSNIFTEIFNKEGAFNYFNLTTNYRQKDDETYLQLLNKIREITEINTDINEAIQEFNQHCFNNNIADPTVLSPWKENVAKVNQSKLNDLPGSIESFPAKNRTGQFQFKMKDSQLPAAPKLELKVGAKVVMVKNDTNPHNRWVNGSTGIVKSLSEQDVIKIKIGKFIRNVKREKWEHYKNEYDEKKGEIIQKHDGTYEQFPVALGWAFTIHKSQGLTLEKVKLDMEGGNAWEHGQTYVALSRCKKLKDISFTREITREDFIFEKEPLNFQKHLNTLPNLISNSNHEHQGDEDLIDEENIDKASINSRLEKMEVEIKNLTERLFLLEGDDSINIKQKKEKNFDLRGPIILTEEELFNLLKDKRMEIAREEANARGDSAPVAYTIAPDRTLKELANKRPKALAELYEIHGLGKARIEKHGQRFLDIIKKGIESVSN